LAVATQRSRWTRAALAVAGGAAAAVIAMVALSPRGAASSDVAPGAEIIAVMPFDATGPNVELLGEGMVNLLATNLNDVGGIRTVDPRTILHRWRREGGGAGLDLNGALAVGRGVDAASILLGSVVEAGSGVRLSAELYHLDGSSMGRAQVTGHADSVLALVDSLSIGLLREIWRSREPVPSFDVSAITTGSVNAIRAYLRGFHLFRTGAFDAAAGAFEEAVAADSTFALAYLQLANAYAWTDGDGSPRSVTAIAKATEHANRLPSRERVLIDAYIKYTQGQYAAVMDTLEWFLDRYPTDAYGWSVMGEIRFHEQHLLFLPPDEQRAPFDRVLALDSSFVSALLHPLEIALVSGDRELFNRYFQLIEAQGGNDRGLGLARHVVWGDDAAEAASALAALAEIGPAGMGPVVLALLEHSDRPHIDRAMHILDSLSGFDHAGRTTAMEFAAAGHIALGQLEALDRLAEIAYATQSPEEITRVATIHLTPYLLGLAPRTFAERPSEMILAQPTTSERARQHMDGLMAFAEADTASMSQLLQSADSSLRTLSVYRTAAAWLTLQRGDTTRAVDRLRQSLDVPDIARRGPARGLNAVRIELARALAATASTRDEAVRRLRFGFMTFTAIEALPLARVALGDILANAGDNDGAAAAYREALRMWEGADASLQPTISAVSNKLERVGRE
jgi:tetratricopeptide (TPR) repeat protein